MKNLIYIAIGLVGAFIGTTSSTKASENMSLDQLLAIPDPVTQLNEIKAQKPDHFKFLCNEIKQPSFYEKAKLIGTIKLAQIINACENYSIEKGEYRTEIKPPVKPQQSREEMAHKMLLLQQAMPPEAQDVIKKHISPTLHAVNAKTFMCPTEEELHKGVLGQKQSSMYANLPRDYMVEKNGVYFKGSDKPGTDYKFTRFKV